jgi:hypothetical protein
MIHSTGDGVSDLKRYVQPSKSDPNYNALIARIGKNKWGNSWNRNVKKSAHYMIGKDAYGVISTAQMLPQDMSCWGCGSGSKGSDNYNPQDHIQIELLDGNKAEYDFRMVWISAVNLCAEICRNYGWTEENITSHFEAHKAGYASNHADPKPYFAEYGLTMNDFRSDVHYCLTAEPEPIPAPDDEPIAVGDVIEFTGRVNYPSANAAENKGKLCKPGRAVVKQIYRLGKSKHPYRIKGKKECTANGWVNAEDVHKA